MVRNVFAPKRANAQSLDYEHDGPAQEAATAAALRLGNDPNHDGPTIVRTLRLTLTAAMGLNGH